jgi:hypothetical protein
MEKNLKQWVLQSIVNVHETANGSQLANDFLEKLDTDLTGHSGYFELSRCRHFYLPTFSY